jgi:hypothetical protein
MWEHLQRHLGHTVVVQFQGGFMRTGKVVAVTPAEDGWLLYLQQREEHGYNDITWVFCGDAIVGCTDPS